MIDVTKITVGTDAEVPLKLVTGDYFPVTGLIRGTKAEPQRIPGLPSGFMVQPDNVNLEFNIPPAKTAKDFANYIEKVKRVIPNLLPPTVIAEIGTSSMRYKPEFLQNPACQAFGCDPDFNAYTMEENPRPKCSDPVFRTAAAHVHVGWPEPNNEDRIRLVKMLDYTLAFSFLGEDDVARRALYGKAGSFRPKEYGIEYRVLGSWWIRHAAALVFEQVVAACHAVNRGAVFSKKQEEEIRDSINSGRNVASHSKWDLEERFYRV